ncbi:hypothetical protein ACFQZ1_21415 [Bacillus sp. CGMCC 1.60114]|uniref:hypothetical protein n=1 Tax=unclassified Bacillus (in: firmicutes) TaxID=185979 RepID=UPI00363DE723
MSEGNVPLKEQNQEDLKGDQQYIEKVPWRLGKNLNDNHVEKLNRLIINHHQRMFHLLNNK